MRINCSNGIFGSRARKYKVDVKAHPISYCHIGTQINVFGFFSLFGKEKNKKEFLKDFKKEKRLQAFEKQGDLFFTQIIEDTKYVQSYSPHVFHIQPIHISQTGEQIWTLGSWNKEALVKINHLSREHHKGELLKLTENRISQLTFLNLLPSITAKQRKAVSLSIKYGYYKYPKKVTLMTLSKEMGVSYSTFQAHLKKAELKLIPYMFEKINSLLEE